jgi:hypothetical protein
MDRVATRQTGVAPAIIEHQTRRNSATTACSVWVMANPGTYRIGHETCQSTETPANSTTLRHF